jgi:Ca2+-binding RTX toxin-like protein
MSGGSGNDLYIVESSSDKVTEASGAGTDKVVAYVDYTLGSNVENLQLRGSAINGTGNTLANVIAGNSSANVLNGKAGADMLSGGGGNDSFVIDSKTGFDTVTDWNSAADTLRFSMAGVHVGNGDAVVNNAVERAAPGGFSTGSEVVLFTTHIVGAITTASAAAQIGSATSAYAVGADVLFGVDNSTQSGVFLFHSSGADALVSAGELTQVALLNGDVTHLADYVFTP